MAILVGLLVGRCGDGGSGPSLLFSWDARCDSYLFTVVSLLLLAIVVGDCFHRFGCFFFFFFFK